MNAVSPITISPGNPVLASMLAFSTGDFSRRLPSEWGGVHGKIADIFNNLARTDEKGLELARREPPDLILCDIQMPSMDGYAVAQQMKCAPALSSMPLIAISALTILGDRDRILAVGFDGYFPNRSTPLVLACR